MSVTRESLSELRLFVKTQIALNVPHCLTLVGFFTYVSTLLTLECYAVLNITRPNYFLHYTVGLGTDCTVRASQPTTPIPHKGQCATECFCGGLKLIVVVDFCDFYDKITTV